METPPSQLVAIRKDRKFVRGVFDASPFFRKRTLWRSNRGDLADDIADLRQHGLKLLYIETCQLHPSKP